MSTITEPEKPQFHGPFTAFIEVTVTDGERFGKVTVTLGVSEFPTKESVLSAIETIKESDAIPAGWRIANKLEWWENHCQEEFGTQFAMVGSDDWDE